MAVNTEFFDKLGDSTLIADVGKLYDLGEDATPLLADHVSEMQDVQDRIKTLTSAASDLYAAYNQSQANLNAQKEANVKLMYDMTKRAVKSDNEVSREAQEANDKVDDALANVSIED